MRKPDNQEVLRGLENEADDILFFLTRSLFPVARKSLLRKGIRDKDTPAIFTQTLIRLIREVQHRKITEHVDVQSYFFKMLSDEAEQFQPGSAPPKDVAVVASCVGIMDKDKQRLLSDRYAGGFSFETIAETHQFSNPVIAQFEVNKAITQLENIVSARLNLTQPS